MRPFVTTGNVTGVIKATCNTKAEMDVVINAFLTTWVPGRAPSTLEFFRVCYG